MSKNSVNRQMAINMASSIVVFALSMCVSFFLTPFIVARLGTAAYGFVGLSNNLIGYTSLLTVVINSMAGRFISVRMHAGDVREASIFMSSIFYTNLLLGAAIMIAVVGCTIWLQYIINIPDELISDVKILFLSLGISSILGLLTGTINVGAFIRNRLDITNGINLIGSVIRVILLLLLFGCLTARLYYIGIVTLIISIYTFGSDFYYFRRLTPELILSRTLFRLKHLKEVASSGIWNVVTHMGTILNSGLDLLLANLFISARAMGLLSLTQTLPMIVLSFFGMLSGNFSPEFTRLYAIKDWEALKAEILKAIRLSGFLCAIPISGLFAYSDIFYSIWLPTENSTLLYYLAVVASGSMAISLPIEPLWPIFTVTNQIRKTSVVVLSYAFFSAITVIVSMYIIETEMGRLFALAGIKTIYGIIMNFTFVPRFAAKTLGLNKYIFHIPLLKNVANILILTTISLGFKLLFLENNISGLLTGALFTTLTGLILTSYLVLTQSDRKYLFSKLKQKLHFSV